MKNLLLLFPLLQKKKPVYLNFQKTKKTTSKKIKSNKVKMLFCLRNPRKMLSDQLLLLTRARAKLLWEKPAAGKRGKNILTSKGENWSFTRGKKKQKQWSHTSFLMTVLKKNSSE